MNYEEFKNTIESQIKNYLPDSYNDADVLINHVIKNNSVHLDGLLIRKHNSSVSPTIYLNHYYDQYENGRSMENIMEEIAKSRIETDENPFTEIDELTCLEKVKDRISCKLINYCRNIEYLSDKPYTPIADLAAVYYIGIGFSDYGYGSVVINNQILKSYKISVEELHAIALQNMQKDKARLLPMTDILKGLLSDTSDISDFEQPNVPMFVLTNEEKINGASKLLDSITMDEVAKRIGTDFYILPSSIHETILVTATDCSISELEKMVMEVNETEVAAEEILSDHVYRYNYDSHCLEIAA